MLRYVAIYGIIDATIYTRGCIMYLKKSFNKKTGKTQLSIVEGYREVFLSFCCTASALFMPSLDE